MIADTNKFCPIIKENCRGELCVFAIKDKNADKYLCSFAARNVTSQLAEKLVIEVISALRPKN